MLSTVVAAGIDGLGLLTLEQYWPSPDLARGADQKLLRVLTSDVFALVRTYSCTPSVSQWLTRQGLSISTTNQYVFHMHTIYVLCILSGGFFLSTVSDREINTECTMRVKFMNRPS